MWPLCHERSSSPPRLESPQYCLCDRQEEPRSPSPQSEGPCTGSGATWRQVGQAGHQATATATSCSTSTSTSTSSGPGVWTPAETQRRGSHRREPTPLISGSGGTRWGQSQTSSRWGEGWVVTSPRPPSTCSLTWECCPGW